MESLRVHLFGELLIENVEGAMPPIRSTGARSLFTYLVINRDRDQSRDRMAGMLWPDVDDARARKRLSQTLWQLQRYFSDNGIAPPVSADAALIGLDPEVDCWVDIEQLEDSLDGARRDPSRVKELQELIDTIKGEPLAGAVDDWALVEQRRGLALLRRALEFLLREAKSRNDLGAAQDYARRLVDADPYDESSRRELMRLSFLLGRTDEALRQYEETRRFLRRELGTEPEAETTQLREEIDRQRRRRGLQMPGIDTRNLLLGRERELQTGLRAISRTIGGKAAVLLVGGEDGIGKTAFLRGIQEEAEWRGVHVFRGQCDPAAGAYAALAKALAGRPLDLAALVADLDPVWAEAMATLLPGLEGQSRPADLEPAEEQQRMHEAIVRTFDALSLRHPTMLVLDDFHAADVDTAQAMAHLAKSLSELPIAVCLSYNRSLLAAEAAATVDRFAAHNGSFRIELGPLSEAATTALVRETADRPVDASTLGEVVGATRGNPLFIIETVRSLADASLVPTRTVADILDARLADDPDGRRAVELLAALGSEGDLEVATRAAAGLLPTFNLALPRLADLGIVTYGGGRFRFTHAQVARSALERAAPEDVRKINSALARALESRNPDRVETIARHALGGDDPQLAISSALTAATEARRKRAYATAADLLSRALAFSEAMAPDDRFEMLTQYESMLDVLGDRERQMRALGTMLDLARADDARRASVERRRAWFLANTDRLGEAKEAAALALELDNSEEGSAESLIALGTIGIWAGEPQEASRYLKQAAAVAPRRDQVARAHRRLGSALTILQDYGAAQQSAQDALGFFTAEDDRRGQADCLGLLGIIMQETGRAAESVDYYERALGIARDIGYRHGEAIVLSNMGNSLWYSGRPGEALARYESAIDVFRALGNRRGEASTMLNAASLRQQLLGDLKIARQYSLEALDYFRDAGNPVNTAQSLLNLTDIALDEADIERAREHVRAGMDAIRTTGSRYVEIQLFRTGALVELAAGDLDAAAAAAEEGIAISAETGVPDFEPELFSTLGLIEMRKGNGDAAVNHTRTAVEKLYAGTERPWLVHYRHFRVLKVNGSSEEAEAALSASYGSLTRVLETLDEDQRWAARRVPLHREIIEAYQSVASHSAPYRLVAATVPTGRPVSDHEWVQVEWTLSEPADLAIADEVDRRRVRLLRLTREAASQGGSPTIEDLARALETSPTTVKRDLRSLRSSGHEVATRGTRRSG